VACRKVLELARPSGSFDPEKNWDSRLTTVEPGDFELRALKRWLDKALARMGDPELFRLGLPS